MNWSDIIKQIMAVVGPLLKQWLADWLDNLLKRAAKRIGGQPGPRTADEVADLLDVARRELWVWQFAKRRLLAQLAADVPMVVASGHALTESEAGAIRMLAANCG